MNLKNGVKVSIRTFTPKQAEAILAAQPTGEGKANREVKPKYALSIADAWERGEYIQTGDTLKWDTNGNLIDGGHRLTAVVLSGQKTEFVVVEGIDPDAIRVIDAELAKRSLADQLSIEGFKNSVPLASTVRATWGMEQNGNPQLGGSQGLTMAQALDFIERRPSIEASAVAGLKYTGRMKSSGSPAGITAREFGMLYEIMHHIDEGVAADFFDQVSNGHMLEKGSPALRLRARVQAHEATEGQHSIQYITGIFIKAWNAEIEGRKPRSLKMEKNEPYPEIGGFDLWLAAGGAL